ncbi:Asp-tRNA(Asn)/Glu-tRNA(Gln) amidotransferase subunit GatB [Coprothermobacter platensis]|uniref:Asp-tRNA(Asn)/Glu-tRNA(Gln) amidotransferase subunit GatB n=1 Tax=Coprothermobacter platensis TaxID=108819 RepID=UPI00036AF580|nr:Asp-tRNA(Asn)/Glu-tRNA(Gln) amidotransferase subunit GatB [Coprothermobacter platensis]
MNFKFVAGLEIHVQLNTKTKMFCSCPTEGLDVPNTRVCPVCLGYPGTLPVINREAVIMAIALGKALNGHINMISRFHRKNYFYPDLPKGYQITQGDVPIIENAVLPLSTGKNIPIKRMHLEEDAAKSVHVSSSGRLAGAQETLLDFNRSGVPLIEIVTDPVFESPEEATLFVEELQATLRYLGISNAQMELGQLRCDVNVSVEVDGKEGTRVEIKNLNSTRSIRQALTYEYNRHVEAYKRGENIITETLAFDEKTGKTRTMRTKQSSADYRYFPEPDLPPLILTEELFEEANRYNGSFLDAYHNALSWTNKEADARTLALNKDQYMLYSSLAEKGFDKKLLNRMILIDLPNILSEVAKTWGDVDKTFLNSILQLQQDGKITPAVAKDLLWQAARGNDPMKYAEEHELLKHENIDIKQIISDVLQQNPDAVEKYKKGNANVIGFLLGQVMKKTKGTVDPNQTRALLEQMLNE